MHLHRYRPPSPLLESVFASWTVVVSVVLTSTMSISDGKVKRRAAG
jgi:hypothetical protein